MCSSDLIKAQGISGDDIESMVVSGSEKMCSHHDISEPQDMTTAQYSAPFSVALAFYRDPRDPGVFNDAALNDPAIRALTRKVRLEVRARQDGDTTLASSVTVRLKNGRSIEETCQFFPGMPQRPLTVDELRTKFLALTGSLPPAQATQLFARYMTLETMTDVRALATGIA